MIINRELLGIKEIKNLNIQQKKKHLNVINQLKQYMKERWQIDPVGCCKEDHVKIEKDDEVFAKLKEIWGE